MTNFTDSGLREKFIVFQETIPQKVFSILVERFPEVMKTTNSADQSFYTQHFKFYFQYIVESIDDGNTQIFTHFMRWSKILFATRNIDKIILEESLNLIIDYLSGNLSDESKPILNELKEESFRVINSEVILPESFINNENPHKEIAEKYLNYIINAKKPEALNLILNTHKNGVSIKDIYRLIFSPAQLEVGRLWHIGQISVAQEHFATAATQLIMSQLYPFIFKGGSKKNKILISCVNGELHELGARMVADYFEMNGWDSHFLGASTPNNAIINYLVTNQIKIFALSVTMSYNLGNAAKLIQEIRMYPETTDVKVIVGGYAFSLFPDMWEKIGADAFTTTTDEIIKIASNLSE